MTTQGPLTKAVAAALKDAPTLPRDVAAIALVRRYAHLLDAVRGADGEADVYDRLGPKLLAALTALGMTAAGRGAKGGGQGVGAVASPLDELRARRAARANGA